MGSLAYLCLAKMGIKRRIDMKIAIFSGGIPSTTFVEHLIEGVSEYHEVLIFGTQNKSKTYGAKKIKIYRTPKSKLINLFVSLARVLRLLIVRPQDLMKLIKEARFQKTNYHKWSLFTKCLPVIIYKPDIFHFQWAKDLPHFMFLKHEFDIPIVLSLRGAHINYTPVVEPQYANHYRKLFPFVDGFHAVSEAIKVEASKYGDILDKTEVIYSPIPQFFIDAFKPFSKKKSEKLHVVSVGRIHWKKGLNYAVDAVYRLKARGFNINYTVIGQAKPSEGLLFQIHDLNLTDNVTFIDNLGQDELLDALGHQDILLLSSVEEGIANVVLEAMAIGLPVISTNCGGMAEVVKHKETGWLVPIRNPKAIVEAVIDYKNTSDEDINTIVGQAHELVKKDFGYRKNIEKFIAFYKSVIKQ